MNNKNELKDKFTAQVNNWKASLDNLNTQLHLDAENVNKEFEKQKQNLNSWVDTMDAKLQESKSNDKEKAVQFKKSIAELKEQLNVDMAKTSEDLKAQQKKLDASMQNIKTNLAETYKTAENKLKNFPEEVNETLNDYHSRFDLFKLHAHLAEKDAEDSWKKKKTELVEKTNVLKSRLEQHNKIASENREQFSVEMAESFAHFRKAFKK